MRHPLAAGAHLVGELVFELGQPFERVLEPIDCLLDGVSLVEEVAVLAEFAQQTQLNVVLVARREPGARAQLGAIVEQALDKGQLVFVWSFVLAN